MSYPSSYDQLIRDAAKKWLPGNYDPRLYKAQLIQESNLNPLAVSPAGAVGIAQFMPKSWAQWAAKAGYKGYEATDPEASIHAGACYMAYLIEEWNWPRPEIDRHCLAMASYNAGLGHILSAQKLSGGKSGYSEIISHLVEVTGEDDAPETIGYVKKILRYWVRLVTENA